MQLLWKSLALLLGAVLFFGGAGLVATWAPDRSVAELAPRWAPPPSRFLEVQGLVVHLRDEGPRHDGAPGRPPAEWPLVLLHGTSASLHTWDGWAATLSGTRRVIRLDLPGFGLTGPHPQGDYSIDAYVRLVAATLDALGVQRVVLAGNSLGGQIAWTAALALPRRVGALVLVDASGYPMARGPDDDSVPLGFRLAALPALAPLLQHTLPRGLVQASVRNVYGDPARVTPALVDRYYELTLRAGNRAALGQRLRQGYTGPVQRLREITVPTLVLWGGRDRLIPPAFGQRFAADIPGSRLVVFPELGHVPHEEDPAATVAAVQAFLPR